MVPVREQERHDIADVRGDVRRLERQLSVRAHNHDMLRVSALRRRARTSRGRGSRL